MVDDAELLRRYCADGSEAAFAELVRRHLNLVYFAALRQTAGDTHLAEDVAQKVFTALALKARALAMRPTLAGWLHTTTRYEATHLVRSERRRRAREQKSYMSEGLHETREQPGEWERLRPVIDEVLHGLNSLDREAVLLRFFHGSPFADIGSRLGVTADAARFRVDRTLDRMRRALQRRGISSTSAALAIALGAQAEASAPVGLAARITGTSLIKVAAAGSSANAALGLLQFMSTTKIAVGTAAALGLLAIGFGVHECRIWRQAETVLGAAQREYDAEYQQLLAARRRERAAAEQPRTDGGRPGGAPDALAAKKMSASPDASNRARDRQLSADPQVREDLKIASIARNSVRYAPLFKALGLSPGQIEKMLLLLAEDEIDISEIPGGGSARLSLRPESVSDADIDQSMNEVLGSPEAQRQFQDYNRASPARTVTTSVAGNLASAGNPLTSKQGEQLNQILADASSSYRAGSFALPQNIDWDAALSGAKAILSPAQWEVFNAQATLLSSGIGIGSLWAAVGSSHPPASIFGPPGSNR